MNSPARRERLPRHLALDPFHSTHFRRLPAGMRAPVSEGPRRSRATRQPDAQALPSPPAQDVIRDYGAGSPLLRVSEKMRAAHRQRLKDSQQTEAHDAPRAVVPGGPGLAAPAGGSSRTPMSLGADEHRPEAGLAGAQGTAGGHFPGVQVSGSLRQTSVQSPRVCHLRVEEKLASFASTSQEVSVDIHMLGVKMTTLAQTVARLASQSRRASPAKAGLSHPQQSRPLQDAPAPGAARRPPADPTGLSQAVDQYQAARSRWLAEKSQPNNSPDTPGRPPGQQCSASEPLSRQGSYGQGTSRWGRPEEVEPEHLTDHPVGCPRDQRDEATARQSGTLAAAHGRAEPVPAAPPAKTLEWATSRIAPAYSKRATLAAGSADTTSGSSGGSRTPYQLGTSGGNWDDSRPDGSASQPHRLEQTGGQGHLGWGRSRSVLPGPEMGTHARPDPPGSAYAEVGFDPTNSREEWTQPQQHGGDLWHRPVGSAGSGRAAEDLPLSAHLSPPTENRRAEPPPDPPLGPHARPMSDWEWRLPLRRGHGDTSTGSSSLQQSQDPESLPASSEPSWTPVVAPLLTGFTWGSKDSARQPRDDHHGGHKPSYISSKAEDEVLSTPSPRASGGLRGDAMGTAAADFGSMASGYGNLRDSDLSLFGSPGAPYASYGPRGAAGASVAGGSFCWADSSALRARWTDEDSRKPGALQGVPAASHMSHVSLSDSLALPSAGTAQGPPASTHWLASAESPRGSPLVPYAGSQPPAASDPCASSGEHWRAALPLDEPGADSGDLHLHIYVPPPSARSSASNSRVSSRRQSLLGTPGTAPRAADGLEGRIPDWMLEDASRLTYKLGGVDE